VLPFTGDLAATGSNVERILLLLVENVNRTGGVAGKQVELLSSDSHSDNVRGLAAAQSLLDAKVIGIVGPESEDLAKLMHPLLDANDTILVSPGISSPLISSLDDRGLWFRIGPSTSQFGQSLAQRIYADDVGTLAVLYMNDEYGTGFASILVHAFESLGGKVLSAQPLELGSGSYDAEVRAVLLSDATACALLVYPEPGAIVVGEATITGRTPAWYLAPPLRSQVFLENIAIASISGTGVSSALDPSSDALVAAFRERWFGDLPLHEAFAYYDGLALLLLAYQAAVATGIEAPTGLDIRSHMAAVSRPPGEAVRWNELGRGLDLVAHGQPVNYQGVTGPVDLSDAGDTPGALVQLWGTENGVIFDQ
jgi:ABC-type branched-subunit amino acid transport system substrate-binding protein